MAGLGLVRGFAAAGVPPCGRGVGCCSCVWQAACSDDWAMPACGV